MALHFKLLIALTLCTLSVSGQFETSSDYMVYYEVIYVVKGDYISVCVAQTKPNQFPFMSALEVRSLDSNMYSKVDSSVALFLQNRTAYGAVDSSIRFSSDLYDRIWEPASIEAGQLAIASTAIIISDSNYAAPILAPYGSAYELYLNNSGVSWCSRWWLPRIPTFLLLSMAWKFSPLAMS